VITSCANMVYCAAFGCNSNSQSGKTKVSFFGFPKEKTIKKVWTDRLGRNDNERLARPYVPNAHSKLCSLHFEDSCFNRSDFFVRSVGFTGNFRKKLKPGAVPTLNLHRNHQSTPRPSTDSVRNKKQQLEVRTHYMYCWNYTTARSCNSL